LQSSFFFIFLQPLRSNHPASSSISFFFFSISNHFAKMSSSRGYSNSRGSHSFSISRNGGSRNTGRNPNSGGRNPNQMMSMLPVCGCNLPMRMYISTTYENPGRRFWSCRRWNDEVSLILYSYCLYCMLFFGYKYNLPFCVIYTESTNLWVVHLGR
jgi:hypothetical protein